MKKCNATAKTRKRKNMRMSVLLCSVAALTFQTVQGQAADDSFKILSLNTWGDRFQNNTSLMSDFFINGNFDVMTFQEFRQNSTYARDLPGILQNAGRGTYSTTQISDVGVISRLPGTAGSVAIPGLSSQGGFISYTSTDGTAARPQTIIGTVHLDYRDPANTRMEEAKGINDWALAQTGPIILTGDYNAGDVSERGLHSVDQLGLLLRTYTKNPSNDFYLGLLREYAKDQQLLDDYVAQWRGQPNGQIDASAIPDGLFEDEMYPVTGNLPQTMNILKKNFILLQNESEREAFAPHELGDGSTTWPSMGEDATNTWASWHRVKIDHFLASRPFGKWWTITDDENDPYSGVLDSVGYVTNPDGSTTPLSDHEPVAHTLRWEGPVLENYDETVDGATVAKTRIVWGENASTFDENGKEFLLTRNNMRTDIYLGQISDENGMPILAGLTDAEKKTLLDCTSTDARFQQAIKDYCIDNHSFIGEVLVTDAGTMIVEEDAALGSSKAALRLDNGTLKVAGKTIHGLHRDIVLESGGGTLDIADAGNIVGISREISGTGGLAKKGDGVLLLQGDSSYTGKTSVDAGMLVVNGSTASSSLTTINDGATLGGIGTVGSTLVAAGGTLAPGNSIGTLKVSGDITFEAGSIYAVEANADGESDLVAASGEANLQGGSVLALAANGTYAPQTAYTIITAKGGVSGTFDDVASSLVFLDPRLSYGQNDVTLTLERSDIGFAEVGTSKNQRAVGAAAEGLGFGNDVYDALVNLDASQARAAFDQLSGEVHGSVKGSLAEDSRFLSDAIGQRIQAAFGDAPGSSFPVLAYGPDGPESVAADTDRFAVWGSAFGSWGKRDGNANTAALDRSTGGLLFGGDMMVGETTRIGLLGGYSRSSFDVADRSSSGDSDNYHIGIYGGTQIGGLGLKAGAAYSWNNIDTVRSVAFPGFSDALSASYDAGTAQIFGEAGYRIETGNAWFEPFANLTHVNVSTDAFTEQGGAAALSQAKSHSDTSFTTLGLRAATDLALGGTNAKLHGTLGWRHAFGDVEQEATLAFSSGDAFTVTGTPIAKDAAIVEAGLDFDIAPNAKLGVSYSGQFASGTRDHGVSAKLGVKF